MKAFNCSTIARPFACDTACFTPLRYHEPNAALQTSRARNLRFAPTVPSYPLAIKKPHAGHRHGARRREIVGVRADALQGGEEPILSGATGIVPLEDAGIGKHVAKDIAHAVANDLLGGVLGEIGMRCCKFKRPSGMRCRQRVGLELGGERRGIGIASVRQQVHAHRRKLVDQARRQNGPDP